MLLVINSGSSSIKLALFDRGLSEVLAGRVSEIGGTGRVEIGNTNQRAEIPDHRAALSAAFAALQAEGFALSSLTAVAHRIVHGGARLTAPCRITPSVLAEIAACIPLAPLHNPANLTAIRALATIAPDLPQYASFDTGFHASNPEVATTYALPPAERNQLRRYGFHGLSYAAIVRKVQEKSQISRYNRMLILHLGNGASLCGTVNGRSVATTMGYSPLDGLTMGTRSGSIDGNAVLDLATRHGVEAAARILNRQSGLLGLGGHSDMRALHRAATAEARFAVEHFCYWAVRHAGSMIAAMGGLDAVVFTGGIGENDAVVRARILDGLAFAGVTVDASANLRHAPVLHETGAPVAIWLVPAEEERQIAIEAYGVMAQEAAG